MGEDGRCFKEQIREFAVFRVGLFFSLLRRSIIGGLIQFIGMEAGSFYELRTWSAELVAQLSFELCLYECLSDVIRVQSVPKYLISLFE